MLSTGFEPMTLALSEPRATNCAKRAMCMCGGGPRSISIGMSLWRVHFPSPVARPPKVGVGRDGRRDEGRLHSRGHALGHLTGAALPTFWAFFLACACTRSTPPCATPRLLGAGRVRARATSNRRALMGSSRRRLDSSRCRASLAAPPVPQRS